ncbi:hypothetical protein L9F63_000944, partial [Diploptera punctata]
CQIKEEIKIEPGSPLTLLPPSPSPSSTSSSDTWLGGEPYSEVKFVLETPPISPPQSSDGSAPGSPDPGANSSNQDSVVMVSPIKLVPVTKNGIKTGSTKIVLTQQSANTGRSVKIQPKPEPGINSTLPVITVPKVNKGDSRTIVISPEGYAALTRQMKSQSNKTAPTVRIQTITPKQMTVLSHHKMASSNNKVPILKKPTTTVTSIAPPAPAVKCVPQSTSARQDLEIKAIKKQQRMIKNRESACLSRKKKKEYLTSLENQISILQEENAKLKTKTTAVMAILLVVSFNLTPRLGLLHLGSGPFGSYQGPLTSQQLPSTRHGRTLLWADVNNKNLPSIEYPFNDMDSISNTSSLHPTCPMFINQTESIRLDSELRRWIGVDLESENLTKQPEPEVKSLSELLLPPPTAKPPTNKLKPKKKQHLSRRQPSITSEVEVYGLRPHQYNYAAFFEAIHRRDDTFYCPALAHNKTVRPKMSLVLPALPFNESMTAPPNHITMMQIDCEVTNTQLLHVKKGDIPEHMRQPNQYSNATSTNKSSSKDRSHTYRPYFVKTHHKKFEFPSETKLDVDFGSNDPYNVTSQTRTNMFYTKYARDYLKQKHDPSFSATINSEDRQVNLHVRSYDDLKLS